MRLFESVKDLEANDEFKFLLRDESTGKYSTVIAKIRPAKSTEIVELKEWLGNVAPSNSSTRPCGTCNGTGRVAR